MFRQRQSLFGQGVRVAPASTQTIRAFDLSEAYDLTVSPTNLPPGSTISADNWIMREGGLTPRPGKAKLGNNPRLGATARGGADIVSSAGTHYQLVSGTTQFVTLNSANSWSNLSWISAFAGARAPTADTSFWDVTQSVRSDGEIVAFMAPTTSGASGGVLQCWLPTEATFSTVTGNIPARSVAAFDSYLLAFSTGTISGATFTPYVQRVQWSDRGDPLTWAPASGNLAGYEDLLDAKGKGVAIRTLENRVILFFEQEVWQGVSVGVPGVTQFQFAPLDRSVGCRLPQTIQQTPDGLMFVANDGYVYLIAKVGGPPQRISDKMAPLFRSLTPTWAVYDVTEHRYRVFINAPAAMTAEADDLVVSQVAGSSSNLTWTNLTFEGDEQVQVYRESAAGWTDAPIQTLQHNGLTVQGLSDSGLASNTTYRYGIRYVRNGVYTSGYSSSDPDAWVPSSPAIVPYSSVFTTLAAPNAPTGLVLSSCSEYTVGGKDYTEKVLAWTNAASGVPGYVTDVLRANNSALANASVVQSALTTTSLYTFQDLSTPFSVLTTTYWAVRHRDISGVTGPISNIITTTNAAACLEIL